MRRRAKSQSTRLNPSRGNLNTRAQSVRHSNEACRAAEEGESAAKYLFKLSHDVIISLDRIGNILCINQRGVELSGYSESEIRGGETAQERREISRSDRDLAGRDLRGRCQWHLCFGEPRRRRASRSSSGPIDPHTHRRDLSA